MPLPPVRILLARVLPLCLAVLVAAAAAGAAPEPAWDIEGSDLGVWDVWTLPASAGEPEKKENAGQRLCLFGYQIDRKGVACYPVHVVDELTYDLVLQVPMGRIKEGARFKRSRRYTDIAGHTALALEIEGRVTGVTDSGFTVESTITGRGAAFDQERYPRRSSRIESLEGTVSATFDCKLGMVAAGRAVLSASIRERPKAGEQPAPPTAKSWGHRVELTRVREYAPGRLSVAVGSAIEKGIAWLRKRAKEDGSFGKYGEGYPYGQTCIAALTLLVCGVERDDALIQKMMAHIRSWQPAKTYEIALALMAMEAYHAPADEVAEVHAGRRRLPARRVLPPEDLAWVQELADLLVNNAQVTAAGARWSYGAGDAHYDLSNTQYASLGLLSAWRCGAKIDESVWLELGSWFLSNLPKEASKTSVELQRVGDEEESTSAGKRVEARGFAYVHGDRDDPDRLRGSMTAGAIASMRIVIDVLRADESRKANGRVVRNLEQSIDQAWGWLADRWCIQRHAGMLGMNRLLYYLYAIERAGVLDRVVKVDGRDWYAEGAAYLIETQSGGGNWTQGGWAYHTCFALLYLKRGTLPVSTGE